MPSISIFMREEVYKMLELLSLKEGLSKGMLISKAVTEYGEKRGVQTARKALRPGVRE
jgi:hypothetical protein